MLTSRVTARDSPVRHTDTVLACPLHSVALLLRGGGRSDLHSSQSSRLVALVRRCIAAEERTIGLPRRRGHRPRRAAEHRGLDAAVVARRREPRTRESARRIQPRATSQEVDWSEAPGEMSDSEASAPEEQSALFGPNLQSDSDVEIPDQDEKSGN